MGEENSAALFVLIPPKFVKLPPSRLLIYAFALVWRRVAPGGRELRPFFAALGLPGTCRSNAIKTGVPGSRHRRQGNTLGHQAEA